MGDKTEMTYGDIKKAKPKLPVLLSPGHWLHRYVDFQLWDKAKARYLVGKITKAQLENPDLQMQNMRKMMVSLYQQCAVDPEKFDKIFQQYFREEERQLTHGMGENVELADRMRSEFKTGIESTIKSKFILPDILRIHPDKDLSVAEAAQLKRDEWKRLSSNILAQRLNKDDGELKEYFLNLGGKDYGIDEDKNVAGGVWAHSMISSYKDLSLGSEADCVKVLRNQFLEFNPHFLANNNPLGAADPEKNYFTHFSYADYVANGKKDLSIDQMFECLTVGVTDADVAHKVLFDDSLSTAQKESMIAGCRMSSSHTRYGGLEWHNELVKNMNIMNTTSDSKAYDKATVTLSKKSQDVFAYIWNFDQKTDKRFGHDTHFTEVMQAYAKFHGDTETARGRTFEIPTVQHTFSYFQQNHGYNEISVNFTTSPHDKETPVNQISDKAAKDLGVKTETSGFRGQDTIKTKVTLSFVDMTEQQAVAKSVDDAVPELFGYFGLGTAEYDRENRAFKLKDPKIIAKFGGQDTITYGQFIDEKIAAGDITKDTSRREIRNYFYDVIANSGISRKELASSIIASEKADAKIERAAISRLPNLPIKQRF
ncbi:MAG: RNase P subunit p30 family protein [Clostridiales bacterium]|jgi:hypothetical protein|nr:RNase P subunit p30 family protein [Clostridiales bacterium]